MPCSLSKARPHCAHANGVNDDDAEGAEEEDEEEEADDVVAEVRGADEVKLEREADAEEEDDEFDLSRWDLRLCATAWWALTSWKP